jgi:hypothetical protein
LRNDIGEPRGGVISRHRVDPHVRNLQNGEDRADRDTLKAAAEGGVRDDQQGLVDYHVRKEEGRCSVDAQHVQLGLIQTHVMMYPKVNPASTPEQTTRSGMRYP